MVDMKKFRMAIDSPKAAKGVMTGSGIVDGSKSRWL